MRIEELVLEGFKSYPNRTQISGWDPSFNAITGLNGSGKSNILDAISFVLGLTTMSTMRASHQADLIYKKGQAGITKASVTIVFNNSDRDKSPVGYENCPQITVTRQFALPNISKYLINGHKSQQTNVHRLFQSIQLNINNPNFVIMQGKITKVLNMRPQEILGMVEEAAGTRMYEEGKDKARKAMAKKQKKLDADNMTLEEEIIPHVEKLREEKRTFLEFQKAETEKERIEQVLGAWKWQEAVNRGQRSKREIDDKKAEIIDKKNEQKKKQHEISEAEKDMARAEKKREDELKKGGKLSKLKDEVAELDKAVVKLKTQAELKETSIKEEEAQIAASEEEVKNLEKSYADKQKEVDALTAQFDKIDAQSKETTEKLNRDEELLQTLLTGLSSNKKNTGGGGGYMGQLADAEARRNNAKAEEEQSRVKLGMKEKDLKEVEAQYRKVEKAAGENKKRVDQMKTVVDSCRRKLNDCGWTEEMEKEGEARIQQLKQEVMRHTDRVEQARRQLGALDFEYETPGPHFDRRKVKGRLGKLVHIKPQDYNKAQALEVTAGSRLYQVVVSDEKIGKDLLTHGKLKSRVTLIPLNKIQPYKVAPQKIQAATNIAQGKAHLALDLVSYDREVENAMSYAFGSTIVCDDEESAKKVTFNKNGGLRSVTLEGDVYDPSGTLSGGSAPQTSGILIKVQKVLEVEEELQGAKEALGEKEKEWESDKVKRKREEWRRLMRELEIKEHELRLAEQEVGESSASRLASQVEELKQAIEELKAAVASAQEKQKTAEADIKKLKVDMEEYKNNKEGKIDELKASISNQKSSIQKHQVIVKTKQKEVQTATLELEQIQTDILGAQTTARDLQSATQDLRKELDKLNTAVAQKECETAKANARLEEELGTLKRFDIEIASLDKGIKEHKKAVQALEEDIGRLTQEIEGCKKAVEQAKAEVAKLERVYTWIEEDKHLFGERGTKYDFDAMNMDDLQIQGQQLEETLRTKKKKVNHRAVNMLDEYVLPSPSFSSSLTPVPPPSVEKRETQLRKNISTVVKDKQKIEDTISHLDAEKHQALETTYQKVSIDFGNIFADLLPGNFAKLDPINPDDLTLGLEVKVRLGSVWKASLTELSGGQRSLIALSLILALLQFKPAPMYILDEIDAALDLQHTQNIGHLFRTRFKGSQFIVVSLKEGLFNNANVLFRTAFRDGTSVVEKLEKGRR
ncbi:Structural maintenance of chromosomes protein 2 [Paramarasmius palmivorus]|uniref:Structural maintenance of chromosomes protein n=1 Tax=Paramarasmius palmivorus TaxID=297713 RepID=A0AAW0BLU4_9AGAR